MKKEIDVSYKLYHCRDTAKRFFKEDYQERIKPYTQILSAVMKKHQIEPLEALLKISKTDSYQSEGMVQMMFISAAVELIDPSKAS